jgi:hypothetical protein
MKTRGWIVSAAVMLAVLATQEAQAGPRVRVGVGIGFGCGTRHYRAYPRPYWGPAWGFGYRGPVYAGPRVVEMRRINYGEVDFNVEPQESQIFVDGRYLGIVDDFNGYPQTAKLPAGWHDIRITSPDGRSVERRIYVPLGEELNFNYKFR